MGFCEVTIAGTCEGTPTMGKTPDGTPYGVFKLKVEAEIGCGDTVSFSVDALGIGEASEKVRELQEGATVILTNVTFYLSGKTPCVRVFSPTRFLVIEDDTIQAETYFGIKQ